jgi:hypothetical protein
MTGTCAYGIALDLQRAQKLGWGGDLAAEV